MENDENRAEMLERTKAIRTACDMIVDRAARMMIGEAGADLPMVLDRFLTFAGAHICRENGSEQAAGIFRALAANIDAGAFHVVTGEGSRH